MARITLIVYTTLKDKLGFSRKEFEGKNLGEIIANICSSKECKNILLDEEGNIKNHFVVSLNSKIIDNKKFKNIKIKDGDILNIFPPVSGG